MLEGEQFPLNNYAHLKFKFLLLGLLGGQKHFTGWAKIATGWAIAHPVNMLSEALYLCIFVMPNWRSHGNDKASTKLQTHHWLPYLFVESNDMLTIKPETTNMGYGIFSPVRLYVYWCTILSSGYLVQLANLLNQLILTLVVYETILNNSRDWCQGLIYIVFGMSNKLTSYSY